ncbi:hydrolase, carbon-nitrogen family protein [Entamoeba histolytica HM-1:IMSS-B]|uniref:Hydrolase, carbon-nitrogen family n=6 Tax=Entamoeba histolytica TaxID=5759 RepID=C4LTZ5_ENTH1|nr:hydrolase, carbon-nitrogen family [Entamoeba histolytica HM-1:IMSS]EMD46899.1 hydrolase carbonnitrogen family protein [Entamoeba histolytica KU27]EMH77375.1 hydrolase, carbon-nitrogen family protein [Entamoeba histolytica HM-1:IMSS-B]EMS14263.1 hydrolase, carbon-nitrogen family protein [Entamoeba histolytica HM-3:IMSS]ENY65839.1 hydrolase, carbon-nitrogen family protein, putative [Entamoeba histolytica HM-1:IMSS-A]GAT92058.1 hydrolase carbon-nitrogen family [Entamoeba histolytica]|eukprot:XP_656770.1 hydrolase, carbon-nitrogen family [Entamoeba histolytica HM-1:IMSS]
MSIEVTLIQTDVFPTLEQTLNNIEKLIKDTQSDLYILPEVFSTGFGEHLEKLAHPNGGQSVIDWLINQCKQKHCGFAAGILIEENKKYYNQLVLVDENGVIAKYNKTHLYRLGGESLLEAGHEKIIVNFRGFRMLLTICYDTRFPMFVRYNYDYDIIINPINYNYRVLNVADKFAACRAIENGCWVFCPNRIGKDGLNLTYKGHSFVYNHLGIKIAEAKESNEIITVHCNLKEINDYRAKIHLGNDFDSIKMNVPYNTITL